MYDKDKCEKCKYSARVNESEVCCVYILIEEHRRGCYGVGPCPKFSERTHMRKPKITRDGGYIYYDE